MTEQVPFVDHLVLGDESHPVAQECTAAVPGTSTKAACRPRTGTCCDTAITIE